MIRSSLLERLTVDIDDHIERSQKIDPHSKRGRHVAKKREELAHTVVTLERIHTGAPRKKQKKHHVED